MEAAGSRWEDFEITTLCGCRSSGPTSGPRDSSGSMGRLRGNRRLTTIGTAATGDRGDRPSYRRETLESTVESGAGRAGKRWNSLPRGWVRQDESVSRFSFARVTKKPRLSGSQPAGAKGIQQMDSTTKPSKNGTPPTVCKGVQLDTPANSSAGSPQGLSGTFRLSKTEKDLQGEPCGSACASLFNLPWEDFLGAAYEANRDHLSDIETDSDYTTGWQLQTPLFRFAHLVWSWCLIVGNTCLTGISVYQHRRELEAMVEAANERRGNHPTDLPATRGKSGLVSLGKNARRSLSTYGESFVGQRIKRRCKLRSSRLDVSS